MQLIRYEAARRALSEARSVDEAKDIADKAAAMAAYARQANDTELERWAGEIRLRAKRRIGEISTTLDKAAGRPANNYSQPREEFSKAQSLKAAGLSTSEAHRCERLAQIPEEEFDSYLTECREHKKVASSEEITQKLIRQSQRKDQSELVVPALPEGKYAVIYADPPWRYEHSIADSREIENQYPTMTLDEICALPVAALSHDDCVLFLWATMPKLREAMQVVESWGFTYRTGGVWDKEVIGMGYYFRQQHELLLIATRGNVPAPPVEARVSSVYRERRGQHSAKPAYFAALIERMYAGYPRIELFNRGGREGWHTWGNQANAA